MFASSTPPSSSSLGLVQLGGELSLFLFEQIKWHRTFVVDVQQHAALVLQVGAPRRQGADGPVFVTLEPLYLLPHILLRQLAIPEAELDQLIQPVHPLLNDVGQDGTEGAVMRSLPPSADEVEVEITFSVARVLHQQAGATLTAVHRCLEVVGVLALALAIAARGQDGLDVLPGLDVDQGFVLPGVLGALEGDDALVVGEAQHTMQLGALLIEADDADLSAVLVSGAHVDVPQRCLTQGPAIPGFFAHSLDDLISETAAVELSDGAHDAVQQHAARRPPRWACSRAETRM